MPIIFLSINFLVCQHWVTPWAWKLGRRINYTQTWWTRHGTSMTIDYDMTEAYIIKGDGYRVDGRYIKHRVIPLTDLYSIAK